MSNLSNRHPRRAVRFAPRFEALEDRSVPAAGFPGISAGAVAIAPEDGGIPRIKIVNPATGEDVAEIQAYEDAFRGGVNVALGDVTGDGVRDLIIAPGAGGGPRIRIVDGKTGDTLNDFFVYESTFTGGINVAVGDVDGDGIGDIITGTGNGGGPRVRVLDGATLGNGVLKDYFAYEDSFRGGVIVASGDLDGDGRDDVVTGTGVGGGPRVIAFAATDDRVLRNFFAYEDSFRGGVLVATGDLDGDGRDDIVTGTGPGGGPVVRAFAGAGGGVLAGLFADDSAFRGGVRVGTDDLDGDGRDEIVARVRHGNDVTLRAFDSGDGSFLRSFGRTVDDNPFPDDLLERPGGGTLVPGIISGIEGGVVAVNPTAGTVDIRLANGTVVAVQAGPGTKIERDDLHTTLAAFQIGDRGEALIGADGTAWEIEAQSVPGGGTGGGGGTPTTTVGKVEGTIAAIDASAGTVTIQRAGGAVVVRSGPTTKIERNDLSVNLAAFAVGDRGEALIGTDGIASKIEAYATTAGGGGTGGTPTGQAPGANAEIEGSVTAIDLATNRVSIRTQNGTAFLIQVVAGTKVERNDVETSLASFRVGDAGQAKIDANGLTFKLEAVG